jgi:diguanylate cyclase (GGDEF)-like protein
MENRAASQGIEELEAALPRLGGAARIAALAELAWRLRERDTRRARALAVQAASLLEPCTEPTHVRARIDLTLAECALLFREIEAARVAADSAAAVFDAIGDDRGTAEARFLQRRIARMLGADPAIDRENAEAPVLGAWRLAYLQAQQRLRDGEFEPAMEQLARIALEAPLEGMDEAALESELAMARVVGAFGDVDGALERAQPVVGEARARGWRGMLASATASVCEWLIEAGDAAHALELLREARASLADPSCGHVDTSLERLVGAAQLAAGRARHAAASLEHAQSLLRAQGRHAEAAHVMALTARALAEAGDLEPALERAAQALRAARQARSGAAEMEALAELGRLHASHPGAGRTSGSAIAFLRHAADIADELDDPARRAALLQELARVHEDRGELAPALAAQKGAHAESARAAARRRRDIVLACRAKWIRERARREREAAVAAARVEERHRDELRRGDAALDRSRAAAEQIMEAADAATLVERLEREACAAAPADHVGLFIFDETAKSLARHARIAGRAIPIREIAAADLESYAARAARERRELLVELETAVPGDTDLQDCATLWFAPVRSGEAVLGVLTVQSRRAHAFAESDRVVFRALCGYAAAALSRVRMQAALRAERVVRIEAEERVARLATVDALTALATRPHFLSVARERLERARRDGGPCALIVADVDAFKAINDIHGHAAGDHALAAVAAIIARQLHPDDAAGRIGGEEFAVLLPGATLEATVAIAERMRVAIEAHAVVHEGRAVNVTMSFGCTAVANAAVDLADQPAAATLERLVREADAALYEAQGTGGNRTIAWPAYQALRALRSGESAARAPQSFA